MATRLCILSDVHGDIHALEKALSMAEALGCTRFVCAGDVVDFGLFPDEVIARLRERKIPTIRGNHERWVLDPRASSPTRDLLSDESLEWIRTLPTEWSETIDGVRIVMTHARPGSDMKGIFPNIDSDTARKFLLHVAAQVLVVGHTHESFEVVVDGVGKIVNPGALLRDPGPGEDAPPAPGSFGVLELPSRKFEVHRVSDAGAEPDHSVGQP